VTGRILIDYGSSGTDPVSEVAALGSDEGVRAVYRAHGPELYRFALRGLGDAGLAEEAVQETFLRAWQAADRFDERLGSLRTWLFAIVRNVVIDLSRARAVRPPIAGERETTIDLTRDRSVDEALDLLVRSWEVDEALRKIGDEHRVALVEVHYKGRPYAEVANDLGVPPGTVKSRVFYGLRAMKLALEEMGWTDGD
jgi:RNA polymerase sigma-70 factor, ECF subfamily